MLPQDTLAAVSRSLPTPTYDRSSLRVGIVHVGVGAFHRSHLAMVLDDLLAQGKAQEWAICGVGLLDRDRAMRDVMRIQDCLYTTVVKHPDGRKDARVIGSIVDYIDVVDPLKDQLVAIAPTQRSNPLAFIENRALFGDLADDPRFTDPDVAALSALCTVGAHGTVRSLTSLRSAP